MTSTPTTYRVEFDQVGRTHDVLPLVAQAAGADDLAEQVYRHARPHLRSRDIDVHVDLELGRGWIQCGFHNGGTFRIEATS